MMDYLPLFLIGGFVVLIAVLNRLDFGRAF